MSKWEDSTAFVSGGGQGIGLGIARALAKRGVKLALADIDEPALRRSGEELSRVTEVETVLLDVCDRAAFAAAADAVEAELGPVGLLFNNAGIAPHAPATQWTYEKWDAALGVNLGGVINGLQTFVPRMIERGGGGYVVNTASGAGLIPNSSVLYTTSKFAVVGLSESLRRELGRYGIDVSVLCPGPVDTGILRNTGSVHEDLAVVRAGDAPGPTESYLKAGTSIDAAGEMVIAGMEARAMWIHTDDFVRSALKERVEALFESFPEPVAGESH
ncbi:SDR family oxidoreductase [Streptomyces sp. 8L]|uniref:SDR family oxidoreductase n=1 Tax=Streptomyces sp. 8L TaxID=2877242 RepID=UPI001CD4A579|nr:SDR family oxidoreductase [Streptomyces sp. 8L]MCA1222144.1 SDR family oxidoreductase [Streptomyces sp. 8L]